MRAGFYSLAYLVPMTAGIGIALGGAWTWLTLVVFFVLLPILDEMVPANETNLLASDESSELENPIYNVLVRGWLPAQAGLLGYALYAISTQDFSGVELAGICTAVGITGGASINVAHELMHRRGKFDKGLAEGIMTLVSYTHFCVEHVHGHHKNVATHVDPATSRKGETVYAFVPRSVFGGVRSFFAIETRLAEKYASQGISWRDRRVRYPLVLIALYTLVGLAFGWLALGFFIVQGIFAFTMLEVVNYLEHYGLEREQNDAGRYGRVEPIHSWSSPHRLTGWILFGLPRHADHHFRASRHYPILRHMETAPQLPLGYAGMILVSLVPPLWRQVMDPRVDRVRGLSQDHEETAAAPSRAGA